MLRRGGRSRSNSTLGRDNVIPRTAVDGVRRETLVHVIRSAGITVALEQEAEGGGRVTSRGFLPALNSRLDLFR